MIAARTSLPVSVCVMISASVLYQVSIIQHTLTLISILIAVKGLVEESNEPAGETRKGKAEKVVEQSKRTRLVD